MRCATLIVMAAPTLALAVASLIASGKFAVIEKSKEFTLVPWRPVLERQRGQTVGGVMRGTTASFEFGKKRGMGIG